MKYIDSTPQKANNKNELPDKIALSISERFPDYQIKFGLKTSLKPDFHIPTIWAVIIPGKLLLCNTNRPGGVWREYEISEINEIRQTSLYRIEIIWNDVNLENLNIVLPKNTNKDWIMQLISNIKDI